MLEKVKKSYENLISYYHQIPTTGRNTLQLVLLFVVASTTVIILNDYLTVREGGYSSPQNFISETGNGQYVIHRDTTFKCDTIIKVDTIYNHNKH